MQWGNEECLLLIDTYQKYPVLWDHHHSFFYNKTEKHIAWMTIAGVFGCSFLEVKKKMESLLASFRRERAKGKKTVGTRKEPREVYVSQWFAFKSMSFLCRRDSARTAVNSTDFIIMNHGNIQAESAVEKRRRQNREAQQKRRAQQTNEQIAARRTQDRERASNRRHRESFEETQDTEGPLQDDPQQPIDDNGNEGQQEIDNVLPTDNQSEILYYSEDTLNIDVKPSTSIANTNLFSEKNSASHNNRLLKERRTPQSPSSQSFEDLRTGDTSEIFKGAALGGQPAQPDDCTIYGQHVANKLREYSKKTKAFVQYHINNILFQADMERFEETSIAHMSGSNSTFCYPSPFISCQPSTHSPANPPPNPTPSNTQLHQITSNPPENDQPPSFPSESSPQNPPQLRFFFNSST